MQMRLIKIFAVTFFLILITGCYQAHYLIRVQPDGSGTIEETFVMSKAVLQKAGQMTASLMSDYPEQVQSADRNFKWNLFDEDKLKKSAEQMGEGVRYVSGERISREDFEGYKAVYRFSDIRNLVLSQNPGGHVPSSMLAVLNRQENREGQFRFGFEPGNPSKLFIRQVTVAFENGEDAEEENPQTPPDPEEREKAMTWQKEIFDPMRVTVQLKVPGQIVQTNAAYHENACITLMDVRFEELSKSPELLNQLIDSPNQNYMDVLEMARQLPGNRMDQNKEIEVEFR
jgi:hypothetical protein